MMQETVEWNSPNQDPVPGIYLVKASTEWGSFVERCFFTKRPDGTVTLGSVLIGSSGP